MPRIIVALQVAVALAFVRPAAAVDSSGTAAVSTATAGCVPGLAGALGGAGVPTEPAGISAKRAALRAAVGSAGLDAAVAPKVIAAVGAASPDTILAFDSILATPGARARLADIIRGAHAQALDGGALYDRLSALPSARERLSSHRSQPGTKQFEIPDPSPTKGTGPILFGKTADGRGTWFQLEGFDGSALSLAQVGDPAADADAAADAIGHFADFMDYELTHENRSRFGRSSFTDANPLTLGAPASGLPLPGE